MLLLSGFAKAADAAYFSNLMWNTFHSRLIAMASPALIIAEITLGALLLIRWKQRLTAALTALMLLCVTAFYLYGLLAYDMTNCGCFGHLRFLNLSPTFTLTRNALLLIGLLYLIFRKQDQGFHQRLKPQASHPYLPFTIYNLQFHNNLKPILLALLLLIGAYTTGYTFPGATVLFMRSSQWQDHQVAQSPLQDLHLSPDSSYLVFVYSFSCPYCQMAAGNVSWYQRSGTVDRVIALAVEDPDAEQQFLQAYKTPPFPYRTMPYSSLQTLAPELPTTYLVRHDTIRAVWTGEVPPITFIE